MQQHSFKPKYSAKMYLGLVILIPIEVFLLWQLLSGGDTSLESIFVAGLFGLMLVIAPFVFVRRIVFNAHSFTIEKYLWPAKTIAYTDVIDIGTTMILTRNGAVVIQSMINAEELRTLLARLIEEGKISRYQIENKMIGEESISKKALMPAGIISLILWLITLFIWPYEESLFRDLSFLLFFVPTYIMVYRFLKNHAESR